MSDMLREALTELLPLLDDQSVATIITNVTSEQLRIVAQFIMFGRIPPGREEDSYIPSKGMTHFMKVVPF